VAGVLAVAAALAGCATDARHTEVSDAAVASLLRSQVGDDKGQLAPLAAGTLLAPFSGSEAGKSLDRADRRHAEEAARKSLDSAPNGQASSWTNPENRHAGTFTPINTYRSADGLLCRDYDMSVTVDGRTQAAAGTVCQASAGAWRVVETPIRRAIRHTTP
jgi:surface antigen